MLKKLMLIVFVTILIFNIKIYFVSANESDSLKIVTVAASTECIMSLRSDGTVWTWDSSGKMILPTQIDGLKDISSIAAGEKHYIALKKDGTVWTWGNNKYGQLGNGTIERTEGIVQLKSLSDIIAIAAGPNFSVALKADGTVWTWGDNSAFQLGTDANFYSSVPMKVNAISDIISITAGDEHVMTLKEDGTVWIWGSMFLEDRYTESGALKLHIPRKIDGFSNIVSIAGGYQTVGLRRDGTVWEFGVVNVIRCQDGTEIDQKGVYQIKGLSDIKKISVNHWTSVALKKDGTVWAWGDNSHGQLPVLGKERFLYEPVQVKNISNVIDIAMGKTNLIIHKKDNTIFSCNKMKIQKMSDIKNNCTSLEDIKINGVKLQEFKTEEHFYKIILPRKTSIVPKVSVNTTDPRAKVKIESTAKLPGASEITITAEDGVHKETYLVNFLVQDDPLFKLYTDDKFICDFPCLINKNKNMVSIKTIFEALKVKINYNKKVFTAQYGSKKILINVAENYAIIQGKRIEIPLVIYKDGLVYIPVDLIGRILGEKVDVDLKNREVKISTTIYLEKQYGNLISFKMQVDKDILYVGEDSKSKCEITPADLPIQLTQEVVYYSSNPSVAVIDKMGNIKGVSEGYSDIYAKYLNKTVKTTVLVLNQGTKIVYSESELYNSIKASIEAFNSNTSILINFSRLSEQKKGIEVLDKILNDENYSSIYGALKLNDMKTIRTEDRDYVFQNIDLNLLGKEKTEAMFQKINEIISEEITPGMSEYEKELALHDYIVNHTKYDYINFLNHTIPEESFTPYSVLVKGIGVCNGYAYAMKILLNKVGIDCSVLIGTINNRNDQAHAWNIVRIDGKYYHVDATYDDSPRDNGNTEILSHLFFNVSDKFMMDEGRNWNRATTPVCAGE